MRPLSTLFFILFFFSSRAWSPPTTQSPSLPEHSATPSRHFPLSDLRVHVLTCSERTGPMRLRERYRSSVSFWPDSTYQKLYTYNATAAAATARIDARRRKCGGIFEILRWKLCTSHLLSFIITRCVRIKCPKLFAGPLNRKFTPPFPSKTVYVKKKKKKYIIRVTPKKTANLLK